MSTVQTNYMSNASILGWMESKTEGIYGKMRGAMDVSDSRADAEKALNDIKSAIMEAQANGSDATELRQMVGEAMTKFGAEFPEVAKVLQPIAGKLDDEIAANTAATSSAPSLTPDPSSPAQGYGPGYAHGSAGGSTTQFPRPGDGTQHASLDPQPVTISKEQSDNWTKEIQNCVDGFGKDDQLGMVNIQEYNSQLNQAKQTASALMDAADKAANSIINHIS